MHAVNHHKTRRALLLACGGAIAFLVSSAASADDAMEPAAGIVIENATATATKAGGTSRLQFRLDNFTGQDLTLIGVRSPAARSGALVLQAPGVDAVDISVLTILDEETLDLHSAHIWAELREVDIGTVGMQSIPFELVFRTQVASAEAHVRRNVEVN